jgi:hypothetical protein
MKYFKLISLEKKDDFAPIIGFLAFLFLWLIRAASSQTLGKKIFFPVAFFKVNDENSRIRRRIRIR